MSATPQAARIREGDEVLIAEKSNEKSLSRSLAISMDENALSVVYLTDVRDERDLMRRSPVTGSIELILEMGGQQLGGLVSDLRGTIGDFQVSATGEELESAASQNRDFFAVQDHY